MPPDHFKDLFAHMSWADALVWTSIKDTPECLEDDSILDTMLHIHEAQHAFLGAWTGKPLRRWKRDEFESTHAMYSWGAAFHPEARAFLDAVQAEALDQPLVLPWAHYMEKQLGHLPADTTLGETMYQLVAHSTHHRAQVNARIRTLGATPPTVDYIAWVWTNRPPADWNRDPA